MTWPGTNRFPVYLLLSAFVLLGTHPLAAQEEPGSPANPKQEEEKEKTKPPSLDELLGLEEEAEETTAESTSTPTEDPLEQRRKEALEARLREQTLAQNLVAAVDDMEVAANMLGERKDPGVPLQRLQLEIIRRLDAVIEEAQRQQQQSSSSSSSSSQQQQQQQQVPQRPEGQQQQGQQQQQAASSQDGEVRKKRDGKPKSEVSKLVGALIAQRALASGVSQVVFDRGGYKYHGRAKALADAAREGGLKL